MNVSSGRFLILFAIMGSVILLLTVLPIAGMLWQTPLSDLWKALQDSKVLASILLTFECGLYATLFAVLFGTPLAYLLAKVPFPGRTVVKAIVELPIMVPHTAAGIALLTVFATGDLGELFQSIGLEFMGTKAGIALGMAFVSFPFYVDIVQDAFAGIDPRMENVARSLGATPYQVFRRIMLPLSARSMITGAVLMWGRGISEFGAVVILAYHPMIAPVMIYDRFTAFGLSHSRPMAMLLIIMVVILFSIIQILSRQNSLRRVG
jgi:molybdate/tungstate transport system permease protein